LSLATALAGVRARQGVRREWAHVSRKRVDLVRQGYESWNRGDRGWVLEHMTPDVEWITPPDDPDPGTFTGYEGVARFWDQWSAAVGLLHFEPQELIDAGDHVVVMTRRTGRGEHSGVEIADTVVQVFTFRDDDKCIRVREFYDRAQALESIGLSAKARPGFG
jgi:ketosteroid isomerase-like protein